MVPRNVRQFVKNSSKQKGEPLQVGKYAKSVGTSVSLGRSKSTARAARLARLFQKADKSKTTPLDAEAIGVEVRRQRGERA